LWANLTSFSLQLPDFRSYDMRAGLGRTYQYWDPALEQPLFKFGSGLSYGPTTFSGLAVSPAGPSVDVCANIVLSVTVARGAYSLPAADVVVQVYLQHQNASVPVPRLQLVQFDKLYNMSAPSRGG
jgi:hypothetical protein